MYRFPNRFLDLIVAILILRRLSATASTDLVFGVLSSTDPTSGSI